ncbi:MAG: TetR/AcrR family transcriptional regulator C-terminal domain-containing protein [Terracidiphilus sp.]
MALDRKIVIATALKLLDEVGLEALTLRRLAERLDVQAPAIYWHFKNKQDLLDEMATTVMRDESVRLRVKAHLEWKPWLLWYGRSVRRMLLEYRDGARMVSGTRLTDPTLYESLEASLRKLRDAGFSTFEATVILSTVYSYAVGYVIEEQAVFSQEGKKDEMYEVENRSRRMKADKTPLAIEAGSYLFTKFDRRFNSGLKLIIAGIEAQRAAGRR